jgi:DNA-binding transcriptional regulator YhcF (GntR family)
VSLLPAINPESPVPPFEQVRSAIAAQIADERLVVGTRLPTVRGLAAELGLAVNTVARAYRELEVSGLVETHGRAGTVVTAAGSASRGRLQRAAQRYAEAARSSGLSSAEALDIVHAALGDQNLPLRTGGRIKS